ncbi:type I secretion system permease/ATPase [Martelella mediterranea]|uniref:Type I secretion system ATP-binding protein PrsD n=1 Tax=Martelella mediterranea DSM 17316 TaxID=1122214 RepID=A0A1U9Z9Y7_9HYPH|nr:type I secretion system permease/ATPase [Martelella mediterranea]AQZ54430.1 Type I secretion system ATP-binding protein PrsD [Martelella mediterranea DSM 17316]
MTTNLEKGRVELRQALLFSRGALIGVAVFSAVVNLLMLTGPLFMLQVYDRVLSSHSSATLLVLFAIVVFLFALMGFLDHVRGRVLSRVGAGFQARLDERVFRAVLKQAEHPGFREQPAAGLRDLASIQTFLSSPLPGAAFDLPWAPFFLAILFAFNVWMGVLGLAGGIIIALLAFANQRLTRDAHAEAARLMRDAEAATERTRKQIDTVRALGMLRPLLTQWQAVRGAALRAQIAASDKGGGLTASTKAFRLLLQSTVLALGALLVLEGQLTAGAMIAGSILLGRALSPIEQVIGQWMTFQRTGRAWRSLGKLLDAVPPQGAPMPLPRPEGRLSVEAIAVVPPGEKKPVLSGVSVEVSPGSALAVIGPSAAGKSTFAKAITGLWPAASGVVRLGGADIRHYEPDVLGGLLGYLPQTVMLFPGTVAQNIARFADDADPEAIVLAAQKAGAHELVLSLPEGYDTVLTEGESRLSGGQRQRIGLARALYGDPVVLVLDEPNASLDDPGVKALNGAIATAKADGRAVIIMSHRPSALAECDEVLLLDGGRVRAAGPRDEVLKRFVRSPQLAEGVH